MQSLEGLGKERQSYPRGTLQRRDVLTLTWNLLPNSSFSFFQGLSPLGTMKKIKS